MPRNEARDVVGQVVQAHTIRGDVHVHPEKGVGRRLEDAALVSDHTDWIQLGVHRPIQVVGALTDLPTYIPRDVDAALRPLLAEMQGETPPHSKRFVLLTGPSSAGKTRAAMEAIRAELPDWRFYAPTGPHGLARLTDHELDLDRSVVWLDEIQDVLAQPESGELLNELLTTRRARCLVLIATLRLDAESMMTGSHGRRLLDRHAERLPVARMFSPQETESAKACVGDPVVAYAVNAAADRYGIAEVIAAGPRLIREWDRLRETYPVSAAIVDAAVDCYRAGYTNGLSSEMLADLHRLYLPSASSAESESFKAAFERACAPVAGVAALLVEHDDGRVRAFDYLLDRAGQPSLQSVHADLWQRLGDHATPSLLTSLAMAAKRAGITHMVHEYMRRSVFLECQYRSHLAYELGEEGLLRGFVTEFSKRGHTSVCRAGAEFDLSALLLGHEVTEQRVANSTYRPSDGLVEIGQFGIVGRCRDMERLAMDGHVDQLMTLHRGGDLDATWALMRLFRRRRDLEGLRSLKANGYWDYLTAMIDVLLQASAGRITPEIRRIIRARHVVADWRFPLSWSRELVSSSDELTFHYVVHRRAGQAGLRELVKSLNPGIRGTGARALAEELANSGNMSELRRMRFRSVWWNVRSAGRRQLLNLRAIRGDARVIKLLGRRCGERLPLPHVHSHRY
ncbi:hypothetical protein [Amycolatopsis sp. NPDC004169]|uniref:hypothetical protein n=1 Tax=Amycolatopsis sp. NPDC004169 TaxID=3154453 RepID=UPI0033B96417